MDQVSSSTEGGMSIYDFAVGVMDFSREGGYAAETKIVVGQTKTDSHVCDRGFGYALVPGNHAHLL